MCEFPGLLFAATEVGGGFRRGVRWLEDDEHTAVGTEEVGLGHPCPTDPAGKHGLSRRDVELGHRGRCKSV